MKKVTFKKEFKNLEEALTKIPQEMKKDKNIFEMTDGNKTFKVRWEGTLTEGEGIDLSSRDETLIKEDVARIKHLMGYNSKDTLGALKGANRVDENIKFKELMSVKKKA